MDQDNLEIVHKGEALALGVEVDSTFNQESEAIEAETQVDPSDSYDVQSSSFSALALKKYKEDRLPKYRTIL